MVNLAANINCLSQVEGYMVADLITREVRAPKTSLSIYSQKNGETPKKYLVLADIIL